MLPWRIFQERIVPQLLLLSEAHRNIEAIWLLRHLKPGFRTIAAFRRGESLGLQDNVPRVRILCRRLDLFGGMVLTVDGTRIKAVNNKDRNFTRAALSKFIREADDKLADYLKRLDDGDVDEDRFGADNGDSCSKIAAIRDKRTRHKVMLEEPDRSGEDGISLTNPDARAMARMTKVGVGYNVQLSVDVKHKLIAEQQVVNQVLMVGDEIDMNGSKNRWRSSPHKAKYRDRMSSE